MSRIRTRRPRSGLLVAHAAWSCRVKVSHR
jgi:hypothetical protein